MLHTSLSLSLSLSNRGAKSKEQIEEPQKSKQEANLLQVLALLWPASFQLLTENVPHLSVNKPNLAACYDSRMQSQNRAGIAAPCECLPTSPVIASRSFCLVVVVGEV